MQASAATLQPSGVWQRRTNKVIATAVIIIGLTMMISTIPQCIYAGLIFIVISLVWLAYMRMLENKNAVAELEQQQQQQASSPVLFLVTGQSNQNRRIPTPADPNDTPPSYEQIIKLDGLPPDYYSIISEKPPRYEDLVTIQNGVHLDFLSLPTNSAQPPQTPGLARPDCVLYTECNVPQHGHIIDTSQGIVNPHYSQSCQSLYSEGHEKENSCGKNVTSRRKEQSCVVDIQPEVHSGGSLLSEVNQREEGSSNLIDMTGRTNCGEFESVDGANQPNQNYNSNVRDGRMGLGVSLVNESTAANGEVTGRAT